MKISVVVPTFNRNEVLLECVKSLINQDLSKDLYEIIIVDDCSTESPFNSLEIILKNNQNIKYIRHEFNKGLAFARNTGIVNSSFDIILFLDSDIVPELSFVRTHLQIHERYPNEFLAVVSNLSYDEQFIRGSNFARFVNSRYLGNRKKIEKEYLHYDNLSPQYFGGGISSTRRSALKSVGMFDTSFVKYGGEDEDMGYRLNQYGVRICFTENAKAIHFDTVSIHRFKLKAIEWKKNAFPVILRKQPKYFDQTNFKYLMPVSFFQDNISVLAKKIFIRVTLNKISVFLLEQIIIITDGINLLYSPLIIRALYAGWFLNVTESNTNDSKSSVWN
jgi:GT2 family glycosyltransferase